MQNGSTVQSETERCFVSELRMRDRFMGKDTGELGKSYGLRDRFGTDCFVAAICELYARMMC